MAEGTDFWTSGSSEGSNCTTRGALWCTSGELAVNALMLSVKTPGHCVKLQSTGDLAEADCSTNVAALCEAWSIFLKLFVVNLITYFLADTV